MKKAMVRGCALAGALAGAIALLPAAEAGAEAIAGHWQVYDDKTGKPDGVIRTWVEDGKLYGAIARVKPGVDPKDRCTKCPGDQKDKPFVGLVVMRGLVRDGDGWSGGTILDPQSGDTYRCKAKLAGADALEVRGFVGISLFGRTQTWKRTAP